MSRLSKLASSCVPALLGLAVATGLVLGAPRVAQAATLVFVPPSGNTPGNPSGGDLQDLDHHYMYTWLIQNISSVLGPGGVNSITGAALKIDNIANWNSGDNRLYMHLLNTVTTTSVTSTSNNVTTLIRLADGTAGYAGVTSQVYRLQDDPNLGNNNVTLRDDLGRDTDGSPAAYDEFGSRMLDDAALKNGGVPNNGNTGIGQNFQNTSFYNINGVGSADFKLAQAWAQGTGGDSTHSFTTTPQDYVLDLNPYLNALKAYISSGNDLAIGFDPDCHFFNDGITLEIYTSTNTVFDGAPEPASMVLLGTGLAALFYRRRRASKSAKA